MLYITPSTDGAMSSDQRSVSAVNSVASSMQKKKPKDSESKSQTDSARLSGTDHASLLEREYKSLDQVEFQRPDPDGAPPGDDLDRLQREEDAVIDYGLNLRRFSESISASIAQIDAAVPKADVIRKAMNAAGEDLKSKTRKIEGDRLLDGGNEARNIMDEIRKRSQKNPFVQMALKIDGALQSAIDQAGKSDSNPSMCLGIAARSVLDRLTTGPLKAIEKSLPRELRQLHMKTVLKIIRDTFGDLDFPQACDLGTCVDCDFYSRALARRDCDIANGSARLSEEMKQAYADLSAREKLHRTEHIAERAALEARIILANNNPRKYMLIIYDYSKSIFLPKFIRGTKSEMGHQQLEIKICAIIVYANGRRYNYIFLHDATLPKGSNTMLTALYSVIRYHKSFGDAQHADTLYLQCDGGVENVSFTPFGMHDFMIRHGWFERIELNRLPVGHSHTLIDAFFSAIATAYRKGSMATVAAIIRRLNETWDGGSGATSEDKMWKNIMRPQFVWLNHVMDFGSLFRPRMNAIVGMRARVLGWLFERTAGPVDASHFYDVDVWYMVSPALDVANGHSWRGCNGLERGSSSQVARPLKLFDQADLNTVQEGVQDDPRKMAPGNMKLDKGFLCKTPARTLEVSPIQLISLITRAEFLRYDSFWPMYKSTSRSFPSRDTRTPHIWRFTPGSACTSHPAMCRLLSSTPCSLTCEGLPRWAISRTSLLCRSLRAD